MAPLPAGQGGGAATCRSSCALTRAPAHLILLWRPALSDGGDDGGDEGGDGGGDDGGTTTAPRRVPRGRRRDDDPPAAAAAGASCAGPERTVPASPLAGVRPRPGNPGGAGPRRE